MSQGTLHLAFIESPVSALWIQHRTMHHHLHGGWGNRWKIAPGGTVKSIFSFKDKAVTLFELNRYSHEDKKVICFEELSAECVVSNGWQCEKEAAGGQLHREPRAVWSGIKFSRCWLAHIHNSCAFSLVEENGKCGAVFPSDMLLLSYWFCPLVSSSS